jgi:hypothetical protein
VRQVGGPVVVRLERPAARGESLRVADQALHSTSSSITSTSRQPRGHFR